MNLKNFYDKLHEKTHDCECGPEFQLDMIYNRR